MVLLQEFLQYSWYLIKKCVQNVWPVPTWPVSLSDTEAWYIYEEGFDILDRCCCLSHTAGSQGAILTGKVGEFQGKVNWEWSGYLVQGKIWSIGNKLVFYQVANSPIVKWLGKIKNTVGAMWLDLHPCASTGWTSLMGVPPSASSADFYVQLGKTWCVHMISRLFQKRKGHIIPENWSGNYHYNAIKCHLSAGELPL